jgi:DNA-binding LacI/PurR family transcriptional regulator
LKLPEPVTVDTDYTLDEGAQATRALLARDPRPTAIIYDNDVMAVAGVGVAQEMGVHIPHEVSMVAWDDSPLCRLTHPQLSAVSRDIAGYGARAAECLLRLVAGEPVASVEDAAWVFVPRGTGGLTGVWSDDASALTDVVEYLVALGHERLARVTGLPDLLHTRIRNEAFTAACARAGISEPMVVPADYTGTASARITRRLLSSRPRPTAIIYDNDVMAVAGLAVAQEMNRPVPGDLSIVAWDDSPLCQLVHPPLTAVSRDIPAYGAHAARHLLALIAGEPAEDFQDETPKLVPRGSTAAPPE